MHGLLERYAGLALPVADGQLPAMFEPWTPTSTRGLLTLIDCPPRLDRNLREVGDTHLDAIRARGATLFDGDVLALDHTRPGQLVIRPGSYLDGMRSSEPLAAEWQDGRATELRDRIDRACGGDPLRRGAGRCSSLAVTGVCVCVIDGRRHVLLGRRSHRLALYPDAWHCAPSGMLDAGSLPVEDTLARELSEEVAHDAPADVTASALKDAKVLGLGFDLLRLRAEIVVELTVPMTHPPALSPKEFHTTRLWPYTPEGVADALELISAEGACPAGASALALASYHLSN